MLFLTYESRRERRGCFAELPPVEGAVEEEEAAVEEVEGTAAKEISSFSPFCYFFMRRRNLNLSSQNVISLGQLMARQLFSTHVLRGRLRPWRREAEAWPV